MDMGGSAALRSAGGNAGGMNNRNAKLWVYYDSDKNVVPPFLTGEVAGSLSIAADREQLRVFAYTILEWLDRTATADSATVYRIDGRSDDSDCA